MPEISNSTNKNAKDECTFNSASRAFELGAPSSLSEAVYRDLRDSTVKIAGARGIGSGVVWNGDQIITDLHVAALGHNLKVETSNGHSYNAVIENIDPVNDLASLRVPGLSAEHLPEMSSKVAPTVAEGEPVVAMGNPVYKSVAEMFVSPFGKPFATCTADGAATVPMTVQQVERLSILHGEPDTMGFMRTIAYSPTAMNMVMQNPQQFAAIATRAVHRTVQATDVVGIPGMSGGPLVDTAGRFIGLNDLYDSRPRLYVTPAATIAAFASETPRFNFQYVDQRDANGDSIRSLQSITPATDDAKTETQLAKALLELK